MKLPTKGIFAEFLGTFILTLGILASLKMDNFLPGAVFAALSVGLFVYLVGSISGAQFNPAVSIGLMLVGKQDLITGTVYVVTQIFAGFLALMLMQILLPIPHTIVAIDTIPIFISEILGTFILTFGIASVVFKKISASLSGVVIGSSLFVGASLASISSNGVINPAVALAINSASLVYVFGPIIGAFLGFYSFRWMFSK